MDQDPAADRLRFQRPWLPDGPEIERYLARSREARWFSNGGPCWHQLRDRLAAHVGIDCIPVASATAGLIAAVAAVVRPGRKGRDALLPSFTFPATAQAAILNGLQPRMLDVSPDHWHLDPSALERELAARDGRVAVVIAVSAFGTPPPSEVRQRWQRACAFADVPLIVDSAAGFGACADDGCPIGAQGDVEVVSFHATKPFAIGEGGAVFCADGALRDRIAQVINFGFDARHHLALPAAFNGKLSELHAATALAVFDVFGEILTQRRDAAARIRATASRDLEWQTGCERSTWQFVPVRFAGAPQRESAEVAGADRLETRRYYEPLHLMPAFADYVGTDTVLPTTERLADEILALPMANDLTESEIVLLAGALAPGGVASPARSAR